MAGRSKKVEVKKHEEPGAEKPSVIKKLTIMVLDGKLADVHPDEVENWRKAGWIEKGER